MALLRFGKALEVLFLCVTPLGIERPAEYVQRGVETRVGPRRLQNLEHAHVRGLGSRGCTDRIVFVSCCSKLIIFLAQWAAICGYVPAVLVEQGHVILCCAKEICGPDLACGTDGQQMLQG